MFQNKKHRIALISVDGDPAVEIGQEEAGGQNVYVRQVGYALAQQGWQVDMFTRRSNPEQAAIAQHSPNCRTIRLKAGWLSLSGEITCSSIYLNSSKNSSNFSSAKGFITP